MKLNYDDLEKRFNCACEDAAKELSVKYNSDYKSQGPEKLLSFLDLIQRQFDEVEMNFIKQNSLLGDDEALRRIKAIAKSFAKRCVNDYGKVG
jgi:hypothetical protein